MGTNIPNKSNGQILSAEELFKIIGTDLTTGTTSGTVAEELIGEVIISANQASEGVNILAAGMARSFGSECIIRLYTGTSAAFGSNTQRQRLLLLDSDNTGFASYFGWSIPYVLTSEEDWTGQVYVQITGQNNVADLDAKGICKSIVITGV